jgi:putative ATPase
MDLFEQSYQQKVKTEAPLAERMRPRTLDEFVGQEHIIGAGRLLRRAIVADQLSSLIFFGPPGTGKTTLARIIAQTTRAHFIAINAVLAGVKDIREAIASSEAPQGRERWTLPMLADQMVELNYVESLSHETVRQTLKKMKSNLGKKIAG